VPSLNLPTRSVGIWANLNLITPHWFAGKPSPGERNCKALKLITNSAPI